MLPWPLESSSARIFIAARLLVITRVFSSFSSKESHFAWLGMRSGYRSAHSISETPSPKT